MDYNSYVVLEVPLVQANSCLVMNCHFKVLVFEVAGASLPFGDSLSGHHTAIIRVGFPLDPHVSPM